MENAWYRTQLEFEVRSLAGQQITVGKIDVYRCFDQIVRQLLIALAREAGMPATILDTYADVVNNLSIHLQIGGSLGEEHQHLSRKAALFQCPQ